MADKFDPYRESLVVETETLWPHECADMGPARREEMARKLHADAAACSNIEYIRVHTGFCRRITATQEDIQRISG